MTFDEILKSDTNLNLNSQTSQKLMALFESVKSIGHDEFPLLRKEYATSSRMPCKDFSFWISQQLMDKDYDTLWLFIKLLYNDFDSFQFSINVNVIFDDFLINTINEKHGLSVSDAKMKLIG